jgi:uncharacterized protein (DUF433 family)
LSAGQLREWDKTGFFPPAYAFENRLSPYSRVYSFKDVVGLRTLSILRKTHHISTTRLRAAAEVMSAYSDAPFAELKLYVVNREVHFSDPGTGDVVGVETEQLALPILVRDVWNDMQSQARKLKERAPDEIGRMARRRHVVHNALRIAGTRIPVSAVQSLSEDGYSVAQIIAEYPTLTDADVRVALDYVEDAKLTA